MEIQYSQLKINHLNDTPSTKAAGGGIFSSVFQQGRQGTSQGQEDFELSWYLFFQHKAVTKLKNTKAPGLTGVPPNAFKAMSPANLRHVYKHVNDIFLGNADHKQWHRSQCVPVPKCGISLIPTNGKVSC